MLFIYFHPSIKYVYVQLVPYVVLTALAAYMGTGLNSLCFMAYLTMSAILFWRFISLASLTYVFTHDMLIVSRGVIFKEADCRSLHQLKGMQSRRNGLLRLVNVSHLDCGLEGPPADRVRLTGIDDRTMLNILDQLKEGIESNTELWREHFKVATV